jgi:oligopeptide/dipeptide ABC transporter ATP-binding protein
MNETIQTTETRAESQTQEAECPNCGGNSFGSDSAAGETYCRECGTVVEEDKLDTSGPRTFSAEDRQDKKRSGSSITYTRHDKGISTEIGSGSMRNVSGKKRGQYYRLRKWHSRSSDSKSRNIKTALRHIEDLINQPKHPYTRALVDSAPQLDEDREWLKAIEGTIPELIDKPSGCPFRDRCEHAFEACTKPLEDHQLASERLVRCHLYTEDGKGGFDYDNE